MSPKSKEPGATLQDPRWLSVTQRDARADGTFFYSVKTTGVYCRPSCAARLARPENVEFHATRDAAEAAGFRPCKRCKPGGASQAERHARLVAELCRRIESEGEVPTLDALSFAAKMSPFHLHRVFKSVTGLTPRAYAAAHRAKRVRAELDGARSVTEAIYASGWNSSGRFYERSNAILGMTPTSFRGGGANTIIRFALGQCSLGSILVAASSRGVCAILLGDDPEALVREFQDRFPRAEVVGADPDFERLVATVVGLVESPRTGADLPLDVRGTAFQERVWRALLQIPPGETASYTRIAGDIGAPKAVRAVARACAANVLAVAIPCHRVVRTDGDLAGYRWGVERKRALLLKERAKESRA